MDVEDRLEEFVLEHWSKGTVPLGWGTAFLYNELLDREAEDEPVRVWLVTAGRLMKGTGTWSRRGGVAVAPVGLLHEFAQHQGAQVTDGVAATAEHVRAVGEERRAYALGYVHEAGDRRPLAIATSNVARDPDGVVRWRGALPDGFVGSPVFIFEHQKGREFIVLCLGLIASAERNPDVATFDVIRSVIGKATQPPKRRWFR
ncbi:hypothetical protein [Dactylosporangium sp. CS-033363]|uniref:hypothetical protein n=1 Tax=Dactylosporangium sp. CS-033363 TaxID=3239935 RepID=UPI003D8EBD0E